MSIGANKLPIGPINFEQDDGALLEDLTLNSPGTSTSTTSGGGDTTTDNGGSGGGGGGGETYPSVDTDWPLKKFEGLRSTSDSGASRHIQIDRYDYFGLGAETFVGVSSDDIGHIRAHNPDSDMSSSMPQAVDNIAGHGITSDGTVWIATDQGSYCLLKYWDETNEVWSDPPNGSEFCHPELGYTDASLLWFQDDNGYVKYVDLAAGTVTQLTHPSTLLDVRHGYVLVHNNDTDWDRYEWYDANTGALLYSNAASFTSNRVTRFALREGGAAAAFGTKSDGVGGADTYLQVVNPDGTYQELLLAFPASGDGRPLFGGASGPQALSGGAFLRSGFFVAGGMYFDSTIGTDGEYVPAVFAADLNGVSWVAWEDTTNTNDNTNFDGILGVTEVSEATGSRFTCSTDHVYVEHFNYLMDGST